MRHLRSIIYALVLAPAVWILCGVGFDQDLTGRARDNGGIESLSGVLLLLLAGAAYAILLFAPISPLGPLLAGVIFAGVGAWARIAPASYAGLWPENVASDGFNLSTPGYGLAVLLAVPLLVVALSARRWAGYEPPRIVLFGTIGRARVAGTSMAAERTTVIPQQRGAGFQGSSDATQVVRQAPSPADPGDGDEKTTVMRLGPAPVSSGPVFPAPASSAAAGERTEDVAASEPATEAIAHSEPATEAIAASERATEAIAASERATEAIVAGEPATEAIVRSEETTSDVAAPGDETTRSVLTAARPAAGDDGDEKTQLLTLPKPPANDEQTQMIRTGTVDPPGDRTQLLTFRAPGETTEPTPSIVAAERPDPAEDPTTRLNLPPHTPDETPTRDRRAMTATNLERPADEAADDTRPLKLPAPRPSADEDTTRHL